MFLRSVTLLKEKINDFQTYPFTVPAIRELESLHFDSPVTFFVGENGSGKSTLLEAIAYQCGFNTAGGGRPARGGAAEALVARHPARQTERAIIMEKTSASCGGLRIGGGTSPRMAEVSGANRPRRRFARGGSRRAQDVGSSKLRYTYK